MMTLESIAREFLPPIVGRIHRAVLSKLQKPVQGTERTADFYDRAFLANNHWKKHYTESHYYPVWTLLADKVVRANPESVIDIGCGPGQFASLLRDKGIPRYTGVDFSAARINQARKVCPEFTFLECDVFASDILRNGAYDFAVCTEFLEHVDRDLGALDLLRPGTKFLGTVPNFGGTQHVRFFQTRAEVAGRYSSRFRDFRVDEHLAHRSGTRYFILEGIKR